MSETQAPKLNAIQVVEKELLGFRTQREQAVANVHAVDGAIQAAQHLLALLKVEAAKAETEVEKVVGAVESAVKTGIHVVESVAQRVEAAVEGE